MAALTLYLGNDATASPFPTTSKKLVTSAPSSEVQLGPGEFDSGFPGTTDSGQWNPSSPIGDTTAAAEIDNTGSSLGTAREGWLYDVDLPGKRLVAGAWTVQLRLRANQGSGTTGGILLRVSVVKGNAGAWNTIANLLTTSIPGEASHSNGQLGWRGQNEAVITVTSTAANFSVTVADGSTSAGHTFAADERLLIELGFGNGNSTADRTWRLDYNTSNSFITTPDLIDLITGSSSGAATVTGTLTGKGALAGSSAGAATVAGTLAGKGALAGSSAGVATVAGTMGTAPSPITGASAGAATVAGALTGKGALAGSVAGVATVSGVLAAKGALGGVSAGVATVAGALVGKGALAGASQGAATVAAALTGKGALAGASAGVATVSGTLIEGGSGGSPISGSAAGTSIAAGTLFGRGALAGAAAGVAVASGQLKGRGVLVGAAVGTSLVSGSLGNAFVPLYVDPDHGKTLSKTDIVLALTRATPDPSMTSVAIVRE